jgi:hypothetical protein
VIRGITIGGLLVVGLVSTAAAEPGLSATDLFAFCRPARLEATSVGVAVTGDITSLARNPGTLASVEGAAVGVHYQDRFVGTSASRAGMVFGSPWGGGVLAFDVVAMSEGTVRDLNPIAGTFGQTYDNGHVGVMLGYGRSLGRFELGGAVSFARRSINGLDGDSQGLSLGAAVPLGESGLRAGLAVRDFATGVSYFGEAYDPPSTTLVAGLSFEQSPGYRPVQFVLSVDVEAILKVGVYASAGAEVVLADVLALRAGYASDTDEAPWRYGAGFRLGRFSFDIAYLNHDSLGTISTVSLAYSLVAEQSGRHECQRPAPVDLRAPAVPSEVRRLECSHVQPAQRSVAAS